VVQKCRRVQVAFRRVGALNCYDEHASIAAQGPAKKEEKKQGQSMQQ
jgi:hypothetical protein